MYVAGRQAVAESEAATMSADNHDCVSSLFLLLLLLLLADATKHQKKRNAINLYFWHSHRRESHNWQGKKRRHQQSNKTHLDFSDLIMEIESIIFYTCYELRLTFCTTSEQCKAQCGAIKSLK